MQIIVMTFLDNPLYFFSRPGLSGSSIKPSKKGQGYKVKVTRSIPRSHIQWFSLHTRLGELSTEIWIMIILRTFPIRLIRVTNSTLFLSLPSATVGRTPPPGRHRRPPPKTATATHPTGMHSCLLLYLF